MLRTPPPCACIPSAIPHTHAFDRTNETPSHGFCFDMIFQANLHDDTDRQVLAFPLPCPVSCGPLGPPRSETCPVRFFFILLFFQEGIAALPALRSPPLSQAPFWPCRVPSRWAYVSGFTPGFIFRGLRNNLSPKTSVQSSTCLPLPPHSLTSRGEVCSTPTSFPPLLPSL